jgi:hypothetical protein
MENLLENNFHLSINGGKKKRRKTQKKNKTLKKRTKKIKKDFHILPDDNKTLWSSDYFGKRQVINFLSYKIKDHVDNLNPILGKFKDKISDEYKRRLKIQLKKNKSSRKQFQNKTKKKYNSKSIDKILSNMSNKKIETIYKKLLSKEKPTKKN